MSQMLKSTGAMGVATLLSRILGMLREVVYANFMGDGPVAAAFKAAFMIPNLFRRLLGEGALTACFIPIFKDKERNEGEAAMWQSASAVISGLALACGALVLLAIVGLSIAITFGGPKMLVLPNGLSVAMPHTGWFGGETLLLLQLCRVMFPYLLLVCIAAVFIGILNARGMFFVPAMGVTVLNVILIGSVLFVAPLFGKNLEQQIFAVALGVLVAGVGQAFFQYPALRQVGFKYQWVTPWKDPTVRQVVARMIPGTLGIAAFQINVLITQGMAWATDPQSVASFDYAVRLMEFPQGIFGVSLATYLLPTLSGLAADKNYPEFRSTFRQATGYLCFVNFLAAALLVALAEPMVRLLFEHGAFGIDSTRRAGFALQCLAPGLVAFTMVNVAARAFYALGDTQTPMKISAVCLGLNALFAFMLIPPLKQGGMGVANSLSAAFNVYFLVFALRKKLAKLELASLRSGLLLMGSTAIGCGFVAWGLGVLWSKWFGHGNLLTRAGHVFVPAILSAAVYFGILYFCKVPQSREILGMLSMARNKKRPADV